MSKVLSQEEVDALLSGISGGEVETETDLPPETSGIKMHDFSNQDRTVKGKMPVLDLIGERCARSMRTSLSSSLRRPVGVKVVPYDMMKYGDFVKTLAVPTSLHVVRMEPLRSPVLVGLEAQLVFCLVDIIFGGTGSEPYQVEGREFTGIENNVIKKVLTVMLDDLKDAWKNIQPVSLKILRSEVNPQFITVVPPNEPVAIMGFELEINGTAAKVTLCYPYAALEPVRDKLAGVVESEPPSAEDSVWAEQFRYELLEVPVEVVVELGKAIITGKDLLNLSVGDVIQLDTGSKDRLKVKVADSIKFAGYPGYYRGSQSLQIANVFERRY